MSEPAVAVRTLARMVEELGRPDNARCQHAEARSVGGV